MSRYATWNAYLGFFVPHLTDGFVALYDEEADQGIVRAFTPGRPAGTKLFGPATLPSSLWTDDGSTYIELRSGATATFADNATLQPGASVAWQERWYPVQGMGTLRAANTWAALNLAETDGVVNLSAAVTAPTAGKLTLYAGGTEIAVWELALLPGQAFRHNGARPPGAEGQLGLALSAGGGERIIATGAAP